MKSYILALCFYSLFLNAEINFIDRIAIIVDDGIIMESELNEALEIPLPILKRVEKGCRREKLFFLE